MKKLIVLVLICFTMALAVPAFSATAGPAEAIATIDQMPLAGTAEICPFTPGEKEVCVPSGRTLPSILVVRVKGTGTIMNSLFSNYSHSSGPPGFPLLI